MIVIALDKTVLVASFINLDKKNPEDFTNHKLAVQSAKFHWNKEQYRWELLVPLWTHDTYNVLRMFAEVKLFPGVQEAIDSWDARMPSELVTEPLQSIPYTKYSYFPPYVGKHPNERYQEEDIERACSQNRFLFNWHMGLGKSYATVICYEYRKEYSNVDKMILLTSNIGTRNLKGELIKLDKNLSASDIEVFTKAKDFTGFKRRFGKQYKNTRLIFSMDAIQQKKVLVLSYGAWALLCDAYKTAHKNYKKIEKKKNKTEKDLAVPVITDPTVPIATWFGDKQCLLCLDECHCIADPKTDRSKAIYPYLRLFKYIYMFSATPADKPEKLYYIGRVLDPKLIYFLKYNDWIYKYNDVGTIYSKYALNPKRWHWEELNKLNASLAKYTAVRTQDDCLDLPEQQVHDPFYVRPDDDLQDIYKAYVNFIINDSIQKGGDVKTVADVVRSKFTQIQTVLENPKVLLRTGCDLDPATKGLIEKYTYDSSNKLDVIDDILEERDSFNERGLIWFVHPETGEALYTRYEKYKPVIVKASMSDEERAAAIAEFKSTDSHKILIADVLILNTSLTLTEATYGIYLENVFSYGTYFQSTGRIRRIGTTKHTHIYHMFYEGTIDLFHKLCLDRKCDFSSSLFSENCWLSMDMKGLKQFFEGSLIE